MYGDSLTEVWEGTRGCKQYAPRSGFDALRKRYLSPLSKADGMSGAARDPVQVHIPTHSSQHATAFARWPQPRPVFSACSRQLSALHCTALHWTALRSTFSLPQAACRHFGRVTADLVMQGAAAVLTQLSFAGESGPNTKWRVLNGEQVTPAACPKLFQIYTVRHFPSKSAVYVLSQLESASLYVRHDVATTRYQVCDDGAVP